MEVRMVSEGPRLLSYAETRRTCGGPSESTIRRLIRVRRFPEPVVLSRTKAGGPARVAFVADEVSKAVAAMIAAGRANVRANGQEVA
jgi:predicted DNA-binding transcriptional regulator AlpA